MNSVVGDFAYGKLTWRLDKSDEESGFQVDFVFGSSEIKERTALRRIETILVDSNLDWLVKRGSVWLLDGAKCQKWLEASAAGEKFLDGISWLKSVVVIKPVVETEDTLRNYPTLEPSPWISYIDTHVRFTVYQEDYLRMASMKIFLSHRGSDKPMVERFFESLKLLGFDPWLDKEALVAGDELHRGLRQGFKDSCAVVFFITDRFRDEKYLRQEINYALEEKTEKNNRFAIITLLLKDKGTKADVPDLLQPYVWLHPKDELEALGGILKALPIAVESIGWRA